MREKENSKKIEINEEMKELVIARVEAQVPSNLSLSIGNFGRMSKAKMLEHIRKGDGIGKKIIESHIRFLRAQSSGEVTRALVSVG